MLKLARYISNAFNPLVVIIFITVSIVFYENGLGLNLLRWFLIGSLFSILFSLFIVISIKKGIFSNFDVSTQKQRPLLFLSAGISVICALIFVYFFAPSQSLITSLIVSLCGIGLYAVINTKIKASVHIGILSVFVSILILLFGKWLIISIVLIPIVAWARVKEKEHTPQEVLAGLVIGLMLSATLLYLLQ